MDVDIKVQARYELESKDAWQMKISANEVHKSKAKSKIQGIGFNPRYY